MKVDLRKLGCVCLLLLLPLSCSACGWGLDLAGGETPEAKRRKACGAETGRTQTVCSNDDCQGE